MREREQPEHSWGPILGFFKGYSKTQKLAAANALKAVLNGEGGADSIAEHMPVLRQGRLGGILRSFAREQPWHTVRGLVSHYTKGA